MAYYVPVSKTKRVPCKNLDEAYTAGANVLGSSKDLASVAGYTRYMGVPIYNSKTGKSATHWVRFADTRKKTYEKVCESRGQIKVVGGPYKIPKKYRDWGITILGLGVEGVCSFFG